MEFKIKNSKGFTLIELLLVLSLISVVIAISYNLFFSGWTSYSRHIDSVDNQTKARQVIREISRELRKANADGIIVDEGGKAVEIKTGIVAEGEEIDINTIKYEFQSDSFRLLKNDAEFVTGIKSFEVKKSESNENNLTISITTLPNKSHEATITSTINIRE